MEGGAQKQQREYFLRRQMDAIRKELGEEDVTVADEIAEDRRRADAGGRAFSRPTASSIACSVWATETPSRA